MSTLKVANISNLAGTVSVTSDNLVSGTAKAWVNFNGTGTVAIRGQFNVTSITDNGVGDYTVNFTNALADANYGTLVTGYTNTGANQTVSNGLYPSGAYTTSAVRVFSHLSVSGGYDNTIMTVTIFR